MMKIVFIVIGLYNNHILNVFHLVVNMQAHANKDTNEAPFVHYD